MALDCQALGACSPKSWSCLEFVTRWSPKSKLEDATLREKREARPDRRQSERPEAKILGSDHERLSRNRTNCPQKTTTVRDPRLPQKNNPKRACYVKWKNDLGRPQLSKFAFNYGRGVRSGGHAKMPRTRATKGWHQLECGTAAHPPHKLCGAGGAAIPQSS